MGDREQLSGSPRGGMLTGRRTILIVDDDVDQRNIYRMALERRGYRVLEASSGNGAIRTARRRNPDIILMDLALPDGLDGWGATRALKGSSDTSSIPVVALSAHVLVEHRNRAVAAGCDGFLRKPITPGQVVAEVRRRVGSSRD